MRTVDVCIPTWNKADLLLECLASLELGPGVEVYVADNGSTDGTAERVAAEFPGVHVLPMGENLGFGRAVNAAAAAGSGEVVVTVNNDTIAVPGLLTSLAEAFEDPQIGSAAAVLLDASGDHVDATGIEADATLLGYSVLGGAPRRASYRPPVPLGPCGGAAAYRRGAFEQVGGFDPEIFAYGEDLDLALRLREAGWGCAMVVGARVRHVGGATAGRRSAFQTRHSAYARGYLLGRYRIALPLLLLELLLAVAGAVRSRSVLGLTSRARGFLRGRKLPERRVPNGAVTVGLRDGIRRQLRP